MRDYLRLRALDQTFYLVISARSLSATANSQLLTLVNDFVAHSPLSYTNFKTPKDISNLLALFQLTSDDFTVFLGTTTKTGSLGVDLSTELWSQTFAYLQMSKFHSMADISGKPEVALERKGGVQLTVNFSDENKANSSVALSGGKVVPRGGLRKRELRPKRQQ